MRSLLVVVVAVFECLPHSLLITIVHAYGFDKTSTEYLNDYLSHRKLKIKINKTFSNWTNILHRVPQRSILGPLICTAFLYDLFLFKPNIDLKSYADDNTPFAMGGSSELGIINEINSVAESLVLWSRNNSKKVNPDKFHLLLSNKKSHHVDICNDKLSSTFKTDNKLTLDKYVEGLCKKASQKVSAVARISSLMRFEQRKCIVDLSITSHFSYYPLV